MAGLINRLFRMKEGCVKDGAEDEGGEWEYSKKGTLCLQAIFHGNGWACVDCWCLLILKEKMYTRTPTGGQEVIVL